ncbi:MAG TPA: hypothetical protein VH678_00550 [Xanthobacteraceae bacterium]
MGKTFLGRLLVDFVRIDRGDPVVFDVNPGGDALADYFPGLARPIDLGDIRGQMAMFDRLIQADGRPKVVDVSHASFERFFAVSEEIGFFREAPRRAIEPIILYAADPHRVAVNAYAELRQRFRGSLLVPVLNEAISKPAKLRRDFPFSRALEVPLLISMLSPMLKAQIERSRYSFADVHRKHPAGIPIGLAFELRAWTRRTFLQFRELELRLLLETLRASLPGLRL